ncbi:MAG: hypothetical protein ABI413_07665 [Ktedonobacteraceae bacterium]
MKRFTHSCYFIVFTNWTRLGNVKVILYTLVAVLAMLAIVQNGLHVIPSMHISIFDNDSDPWNG